MSMLFPSSRLLRNFMEVGDWENRVSVFFARSCNRYTFPTVCIITDTACMVHSDQRPAEVLAIFLFQQMFRETGGNFVSRSALVS